MCGPKDQRARVQFSITLITEVTAVSLIGGVQFYVITYQFQPNLEVHTACCLSTNDVDLLIPVPTLKGSITIALLLLFDYIALKLESDG